MRPCAAHTSSDVHCNTTQALKHTLLSAGEAPTGGKWEAVVYDWCVVGGRSGVLHAPPPASDTNNDGKEAGKSQIDEDDDDEATMSVMEELVDDRYDMMQVREGSVGYQQSGEAARIINGDGIHVLVALDGWNVKNRNNILIHRSCAVQVAALGHRSTMADTAVGAPRMTDALVGGRVSTPPEYAAHFSEGLVMLPLGYMPPCPTRALSPTRPLQYTSQPEMPPHHDPAAQRRAARQLWGGGEGRVIMGVFGPIEALSRQALKAWSSAHSATDSASRAHITISLPAMSAASIPLLQAELATYAHGKMGEGGTSSSGARVEGMDAASDGWHLPHLDGMGDEAFNTSMRLYGADVVLDTWHVSSGPLVAKALALQRPILTLPHESMASRTGAEHAVALKCQVCAIARSSDDAASYVAALARQAIKTATGGSSSTHYPEYGASTPQWSMQFIKGLRLLLDAHMTTEHDDEAGWGRRYQVAVAH